VRVLHVSQRYWPAVGGAEAYLAEISQRLVLSGHQVTIATTDALDIELFWNSKRRRVACSEEEHRGVRILRFPVRHLPLVDITYPALRRLLWLGSRSRVVPLTLHHRFARFTPWVPALWQWLRATRDQFDVVAATTICFETLVEAGLWFARRHGVPFVVHPLTHLGAGASPGEDNLSRFYTMRHQVALSRASNAVVAMTPSEQHFYLNKGVSQERLVVIGPGVNPADVLGGDGARFRSRHGLTAPIVACLSTLTYDKGSMHLVEAMRRLWLSGREVHLVLAGATLESFRQYLAVLPEDDRHRLHVLGPIEDSEKRDLLAAADIFVMPSRTDSFGIVYLEAWLYGKPVIGARTWGVCDVIRDGVDGILVPFGATDELAESISHLLDIPERSKAMGRAGREKVLEQFTWDHQYPPVHELYQSLAAKR